MRKLISIIIALAVCGGALAQQKQGHVRRPKPRGVGVNTVVGQAQLEVQYAFNGLPGLILKVYDTEKLYVYEAVSLRSGNFPIKKRGYKEFSKDSRDHIYRLQVAANRDHLKTGGAISRTTGLPASKKHPYEPLEKE